MLDQLTLYKPKPLFFFIFTEETLYIMHVSASLTDRISEYSKQRLSVCDGRICAMDSGALSR